MNKNGYINEIKIFFLLIFCLHRQYKIPFSKQIPKVIGIVKYSVKYVGYPTLWVNDLIDSQKDIVQVENKKKKQV